MKLLYLAAIRLPTEKAHGLQILKTCEAFAEQGVDIELMVPTRHNSITDDPLTYYGVKTPFKITYLKARDMVRQGPIGFALSILSFAEAVHFSRSYWAADIIYSRDALILAQYVLHNRKLVYEAHTRPTLVSKFIAKRAYRVVTISNGLRLAYEKIGVHKERIIVAPDAIDLDAFSATRVGAESTQVARARLGLPLNKKVVLYTGRLDGWKGTKTLFEASKLLPSDILVAVIGGEPEQVSQLKKDYPQVYFLGERPYTQLPNNQSAGDVLVLPNTGKNIDARLYTSPLKLFTYMASGKPIIASDLPSIREILDEESAYFFIPDDAESLAQKIIEACTHAETATTKAEKAQKLVERYSWKERANTILEKFT